MAMGVLGDSGPWEVAVGELGAELTSSASTTVCWGVLPVAAAGEGGRGGGGGGRGTLSHGQAGSQQAHTCSGSVQASLYFLQIHVVIHHLILSKVRLLQEVRGTVAGTL